MTTKKSKEKTASSAEDIRVIKKYPNRRLYDTVKRSYITLNDIKQYVLDHINFQVIDAETEADLTRATLFQVITENENSANTLFTTELLQQMIQLYDENMQNVFSNVFEQFLTQFIHQKDLWAQQFEKYHTKPTPDSIPNFLNPFKSIKDLTQIQQEFWENLLRSKPEKK